MHDWDATKAAAEEQAHNCECKCDQNRVYAIMRTINAKAARTYNNLRTTPKGNLPTLDGNGEYEMSWVCKTGKKNQ